MVKKQLEKLDLQTLTRLCSGVDFWHTAQVTDSEGNLLADSLLLSDGPHGIRKQDKATDHLGIGASVRATCFPTATVLACSWDKALAQEMGRALGKEARYYGVDILLGPGVNIKRNPLGGRNFEYFSEDPTVSGHLGGAYCRGLQSVGVGACLKHFACNNQETSRMTSNSVVDKRTLHEMYLRPFELAIQIGKPQAVMSSYNQINSEYVNQSKYLLTDVLRGRFGHQGMVVSDWGGCVDAVEALKAGSDLQMPHSFGAYDHALQKAVTEGKLSKEEIATSVARTLSCKTSQQKHKEPTQEHETVDFEQQHRLAAKIASQSVVLLKNTNQRLPLKGGVKVAFVGPFVSQPQIQGGGSSQVNACKVDTIADLCAEYDWQVVACAKRFCKKAKKADVVVCFVGDTDLTCVEGIDKASFCLPKHQTNLLRRCKKAGKSVVVVLSSSGAVDTSWDEGVDALLYTGFCGQGGAQAVLDILAGVTNPSGRLAETFAGSLLEYPNFAYYPGRQRTAEYREALFVGYRYFVTRGLTPKYAFGSGLGYADLVVGDVSLLQQGDRWVIGCEVVNQSEMEGSQVLQVYVSQPDCIWGGKRVLKNFEKIWVKPKSQQKVQLTLTQQDFAFFDSDTDAWQWAGGEYLVELGISSLDIVFGETVRIASTLPQSPQRVESLQNYYLGKVDRVTDAEYQALLASPLPPRAYAFVGRNFFWFGKKYLRVDSETSIKMLRYAKGWFGRFVAGLVRCAVRVCKILGKKRIANLILMGAYELPLRNLVVFSGGRVTVAMMEGIVQACNGHFFAGLRKYTKAKRQAKRDKRAKAVEDTIC